MISGPRKARAGATSQQHSLTSYGGGRESQSRKTMLDNEAVEETQTERSASGGLDHLHGIGERVAHFAHSGTLDRSAVKSFVLTDPSMTPTAICVLE